MSRKPVRGGDPARGGGEARRPRETAVRNTRSAVPSPTRPLRGSGDVGSELRGPGCADSLNAALAHSPLRNRQCRGFPRGGHSIQPLYTPRAPAAAPPPPHKMAAPIEETASVSPAPFCGR